MLTWDEFFINVCDALSTKSPCLSRQIGAVIVFDKSIISSGYNGPPRGYPHCIDKCPRHSMEGYNSGVHLDKCNAVHAEVNAIITAARIGASCRGATLYLNTDFPCKECMAAIVNAGINTVVSTTGKFYHKESREIAKHGRVTLLTMEVS